MEISDKDRRLIRALQLDARASVQDLADQAGLSASVCWRRIKSLEDSGVISRYSALVDAEAVGLGFSAIVHVTLERHLRDHVDTFIAAVTRRPEVLDCFATTGEADYHLKIICKDKDDYNRFLDDVLFQLPGIAHVRTNLILKTLKNTAQLPL